jgi:prolipoprotein diacylglyceryltransferase
MVSIHKKMKGWVSIKKLITSDGFVSGVFFVLAGVIGLWVAKGYQVGTAHQMGSGYFPRLLCIGMIILGSLSMLSDSSKEETHRHEVVQKKRQKMG